MGSVPLARDFLQMLPQLFGRHGFWEDVGGIRRGHTRLQPREHFHMRGAGIASDHLLLLSGTGDVIQPTDGVAAIGSGGSYAQAAARALVAHTELPAADVVRRAMEIAADLCIYTNRNIEVEEVT